MADFSVQLAEAQRLHNQGKREQARAVVLRVLQRAPADPMVNQVMAALLAIDRRHDQALYYIDRALAGAPEVAQYLMLKATILSNTPRVLEAIPILRRATELAPTELQAWCALGALEIGARRYSDAEASLRRALALRPDHPDAAAPLASLLLDTGHPEAAVDLLRRASAAHPANLRLAETLAFCVNYDHRATPRDVFEAHRGFGAILEGAAGPVAETRVPTGAREAGGRLRIGYVSPDLRRHAVATFFEPVLSQHDRAGFEVFVYHTSPVVDDTTGRMRAAAEHWFGSRILGDAELFDRMRADRLDILVELSGLTSQHRLAVMARRPAPIQATFIGYPNTTGLARMDYQIVDGVTDPPGAEAFATERLARLPHCLLCYTPPADCPEPATVGGEQRPFTFASFNTVGKTTGFTLSLWARVLAAVPGSRLLLKASGLSDAATHAGFAARAADAGIAPDRLVLMGFSPRAEHMAAYAQADVCLDPFPFNGATTTCDALWMGLPVVTLAGDRHVARASASILTALGHREWIAATPEEYVRIASGLGADRAGLAATRAALRGRMLASPLCDSTGYTRALEALYRGWVAAGSAEAGGAHGAGGG